MKNDLQLLHITNSSNDLGWGDWGGGVIIAATTEIFWNVKVKSFTFICKFQLAVVQCFSTLGSGTHLRSPGIEMGSPEMSCNW